ncbi:hypothetical protein DPEC_G00266900 [Dallia pectoralis]|uniref:Uncharacterized protein n=1 Tax=Dallia pectoralis TaxID=75939 RepID=A0ACC2FN75_DALPE|nr:hypothetical protein DPEC_G00266900 [Dallia pectoralis]
MQGSPVLPQFSYPEAQVEPDFSWRLLFILFLLYSQPTEHTTSFAHDISLGLFSFTLLEDRLRRTACVFEKPPPNGPCFRGENGLLTSRVPLSLLCSLHTCGGDECLWSFPTAQPCSLIHDGNLFASLFWRLNTHAA